VTHRRLRAGALVAALSLVVLASGRGVAHEGDDVAAASPVAPRFDPPAPGTYELPPILEVAPHELLDPKGEHAPLLGLQPGEAALVSFVYLGCADQCPMATAVLQQVDRRISERPELAGRVVLVTVSFDPARDRPEQMGRLARALAPRGRWRFLTAPDPTTLAPVLEDFGQDAEGLVAGAVPGARFSHVMKVFLVDGESRVRNVYSAGFLDARVLVNDLLTVIEER
jgi:cytochrome oxidase Cu insertion factor (SCO1/SenC/PrrC family)